MTFSPNFFPNLPPPVLLSKRFDRYNIGELWVAAAHKLMHHPRVFKAVHKKHHCPVNELVASVAWLDTTAEFLLGA